MRLFENGRRLLLPTILTICTFAATAEVYKWVDENGKVHYSDKPINQDSKQIQIRDSITPEQQRKAQQETRARLERQKKRLSNVLASENEEKKRAEKAQKKAAERQRYCADMKEQLAVLDRQARVYEINKKGERVYMEDDRREKEKVNLKRHLTEQCTD